MVFQPFLFLIFFTSSMGTTVCHKATRSNHELNWTRWQHTKHFASSKSFEFLNSNRNVLGNTKQQRRRWRRWRRIDVVFLFLYFSQFSLNGFCIRFALTGEYSPFRIHFFVIFSAFFFFPLNVLFVQTFFLLLLCGLLSRCIRAMKKRKPNREKTQKKARALLNKVK